MIEVAVALIGLLFVAVQFVYKRLLRPLLGLNGDPFEKYKSQITVVLVLVLALVFALGAEAYFLEYADEIDRYGAVLTLFAAAVVGSAFLDNLQAYLTAATDVTEYIELSDALSDGVDLTDLIPVVQYLLAYTAAMEKSTLGGDSGDGASAEG